VNLPRLWKRLRNARIIRFGIVGGAGFVVNEAALWMALNFAHFNRYTAQIPAFFVAVTFTWWGNRVLTFREHAAQTSLIGEWAKFVLANGFGAIANYTLYVTLLRFGPYPVNSPYLALTAGTLLGLLFNFTMSKRFVFRGSSRST